MSDQFMSVQMVSQLELPVTSLAKALNDIFCPFRLRDFLFCLSDCIHKGKIGKKRVKGKSRDIVQEGKDYSREA